MEESEGEGELRHNFCIISLPLGVNGLDESWSEPLLSSGGRVRFPVLVLETSRSSVGVGVDDNFDGNCGNMGATTVEVTGGVSSGE